MTDKLPQLVKDNKPKNLVVMASVVDISNLKLLNNEDDKIHVSNSNQATLNAIEQQLEDNPDLHVTLVRRPPRIDKYKIISQQANLDLFMKWAESMHSDRINLTDLKIEPKYSESDCFGFPDEPNFDGVHW